MSGRNDYGIPFLKGFTHGAFKYGTAIDEELELVKHLGMFLRDVAPPMGEELKHETPMRWMKAMREMTKGYDVDIPGLFKDFEGGGYDGMVTVGPIQFYSTCEHHLLPFHGRVWVGYLPNVRTRRIVGLSKVARLVTAHAKRLQVQERMTHDIAADMAKHLKASGVGVRIESLHTCMCARGIEKEGIMRTQSLLGAIKRGSARAEFIQLCTRAT